MLVGLAILKPAKSTQTSVWDSSTYYRIKVAETSAMCALVPNIKIILCMCYQHNI